MCCKAAWAWLFLVLCASAAPARGAPRCELRGRPYLEGRLSVSGRAPVTSSAPLSALSRVVDLQFGQSLDVFLVAPGRLEGRAVLFSESGGRGRVSWVAAGCPKVDVVWSRVEPRMQHERTPAPNKDEPIYSNAVFFGPRHGAWIGFDRIEYFESPIQAREGDGWVLPVKDATPTERIALHRAADLLPLGTMRLKASVTTDAGTFATPGAEDASAGWVSDRVFRFTVRRGDGFLGWVTSFFNVPYLFGSAGKGVKSQAERYIGADCADLLVAALRRSGARQLEYSSVIDLVGRMPRVGAAREMAPCPASGDCRQPEPRLRFGSDVRPGDLLALDYIGVAELPRAWDHIVAVVEDRGPGGGPPDGLLGPEDLVADSGSAEGLKFAPLGEQGHVRVAVLRPRLPPAKGAAPGTGSAESAAR